MATKSQNTPDAPAASRNKAGFFARCFESIPWREKQQHRRLVARGPVAILRWRNRNHTRRLKLAGIDLRGAQLPGAVLGGSDLRGADLTEANLEGATVGDRLRGARMNGANLRYATLSGAAHNADLHRADLTGAQVCLARLDGANLRGAHMAGADCGGTSFRQADLRDADLRHADLDDAALDGARLSGADFNGAKFYMARLTGCDLAGADFTGANLTEADLAGATNHEGICGIRGASVHRVQNAPDGFVAWALEHGATEQARNRSWAPADSLKAKADAARKILYEERMNAVSKRRIIWPIVLTGFLFMGTGIPAFIWGGLLPLANDPGISHLGVLALSSIWTLAGAILFRFGWEQYDLGVD